MSVLLNSQSERALYKRAGIVPMDGLERPMLGTYLADRDRLLAEVRHEKLIIGGREDLLDFTLATFDQGDFLLNWHVRVLCDTLMEFEKPDSGLDRLIITMPPRSTKSEICTRRFPAWCLGRMPRQRPVVIGAYGASLAEDFSKDVQAIIDGDAFRRTFPGIYLNPRNKGVKKWALNNYAQNACIAVGRKGALTGKGGGIMLLDDPIKDEAEARSSQIREILWRWYLTTYRTRLEPQAKVLIIMTRWDEDDLVARIHSLMEIEPNSDQFVTLNLPAIAVEDDEYRLAGEALHAARYSVADLLRTKATMGARDFEALYQGNPVPPEGSRFKRSWFKEKIDPSQLPKYRARVRYWDWATKKEGGDFTVGTLASVDQMLMRYVEDVVRGQWEWSQAKKHIIATAERDGFGVVVGIEQIAKDATILKELKRYLRHRGFTVFTYPTRQKKEIEAKYAEELAEAGMITVVRGGHWYGPWIGELCSFPFGTNDDQVDSFSGTMNYLRGISADSIKKMMDLKENELPDWMLKDKVTDAHRVGKETSTEQWQGLTYSPTSSSSSDFDVASYTMKTAGETADIEMDIRNIV